MGSIFYQLLRKVYELPGVLSGADKTGKKTRRLQGRLHETTR